MSETTIEHAAQRILEKVDGMTASLNRPVVVAIDGGSGAGKTTLAGRIAEQRQVAVVTLDDFYQTSIPETRWPELSVEERLQGVFDWNRVKRDAIDPLRLGKPGRWHAFDFLKGLGPTGTYDLKMEATEVRPAPIIILEGAYSASPPVRDVIDLAILVSVPRPVRHARVEQRERDLEDFLDTWHFVWDAVENHYFEQVCPPTSFDLVVSNSRSASG